MTDESRRVHAGRGIGALLPAITRPAFRKRSPAATQLLADWPAIIGPELAAVTAPRRLSSGSLTIACAGPVAMELQHLAPQLIERINAHAGQALVSTLRFTQDFPADKPARPVSPESRPPRPDPDAAARLEKQLAALPEGPLKEALTDLGRSIQGSRPVSQPGLSTAASRRG